MLIKSVQDEAKKIGDSHADLVKMLEGHLGDKVHLQMAVRFANEDEMKKEDEKKEKKDDMTCADDACEKKECSPCENGSCPL
jgi:hypothetical protein